MKFTKELCGSRLEILIHQEGEFSDLIQECFKIGEMFEKKYSRFIEGNYLYNLNKNKESLIDEEFLSIIKLCSKVSDITDGYFDITIQPILEELGYGIDKKINKNYNIGYKNIIINNDKIILKNNITIDIGSVGKGYIVDKIFNILSKSIQSYSINFGGDIRIKGEKNIKLQDPLDNSKYIGTLDLKDNSLSSSSGNKRIFGKSHHLINPKNKTSEYKIQAVFMQHNLTAFSDIFATALYVTPLEKSIEILSSISGLEGMIIDSDGNIYKSKGFDFKK